MRHSETALLVGGPRDGASVETYPGQSCVKAPCLGEYVPGGVLKVAEYRLHRVHDSAGFHRLIGLLTDDTRGPMQALYEGYKKENVEGRGQ